MVESGEVFRRHYWIPHQLILTEPRLEDMIWDECLNDAHKANLIPVGPVMVRRATAEETEKQLKCEHPFKRTEIHLGGEVLYVAEVIIGTSLE